MEDQWNKKIPKPSGVYIGSLLIIISGISVFFQSFFEIKAFEGELILPLVVIDLGLPLLTAGAAIWALTGQNEGRIALLITLPLSLLWAGIFVVWELTDNTETNDKEAVMTAIRLTFSALSVIGVEWYFMSKKVVEYYKQNG